MYSNVKAYLMHIQMLEIMNIILYVTIILLSTILTLIITKNFLYAFIVFLISILVGYIIYSIIQLKADYYKMQIDIYTKISELDKNK